MSFLDKHGKWLHQHEVQGPHYSRRAQLLVEMVRTVPADWSPTDVLKKIHYVQELFNSGRLSSLAPEEAAYVVRRYRGLAWQFEFLSKLRELKGSAYKSVLGVSTLTAVFLQPDPSPKVLVAAVAVLMLSLLAVAYSTVSVGYARCADELNKLSSDIQAKLCKPDETGDRVRIAPVAIARPEELDDTLNESTVDERESREMLHGGRRARAK